MNLTKDKCYISGPMTGYENFNYPAFTKANQFIRELGWEPVDPAENFGGNYSHPGGRKAYMRLDFIKVLSAKRVAFLPGWQDSKGARAEAMVAYELELEFWQFNDDLTDLWPMDRSLVGQILGLEPIPYETVCAKADRLVSTARGNDYGHPLDDFTRTGRMWGAILGIPDVPPELVGLCMIAVKVSREVNQHKSDNDSLTDICGYAKTIEMVHSERQKRTDEKAIRD